MTQKHAMPAQDNLSDPNWPELLHFLLEHNTPDSSEMPLELALELYHSIIGHVDDPDVLISLALCCSAFRDEAQRFLFRHAEPGSLHRRKQFISVINDSPLRLGSFIHTFYIHYDPGSDQDNYSDEDRHVVSLSLALRAMRNLKHFRNEGVQLSSTILRGCTFELRTLIWNCPLDKSHLLFLLCSFLPTQHSIKHVRFSHTAPFDIAAVATNLCPKLISLGAMDIPTMNAFLRDNRPITRFQWYRSGGLPKMSIRQLNHLEYLLCGIHDLGMNTEFTLQLTSLVFLELRVDTGSILLDFLIQFLRNIPRLQVLVFHISDKVHILTGHNTTAYQRAFELCPTLKYIDAGQEGNLFYNRFLRSGNGHIGLRVRNMLPHEQEVVQ